MFDSNTKSHWAQRFSLAPAVASLTLAFALPMAAAAQGEGKGVKTGPKHSPPAERPLLKDIPPRGIGDNFQLMDHNPLPNPGQTLPRGGNGIELGFVRNCLYIPSRPNTQGTLIVDISNPRRTEVVGSIPPTPSPTPATVLSTEILATIESENLLVRQYRSMPEPGLSPEDEGIEIYDTTDCFNPELVSKITLPDGRHEIFIWQGGDPHRVLLYVSFQSGGPDAIRRRVTSPFPDPPFDIDMRVYDITNKFNPVGPVAEWSLQRFGVPTFEEGDLLKNAGQPQRNTQHTMSVSADGTRVYVPQISAGFYILDSTPLAKGEPCDVDPGRTEDATAGNPFGVNPNACLKKLHPDPNVRLDYHPPIYAGTHSAYKVPERPYVILNDEPVGGNCPGSWPQVVFIDDEREVNINPLVPSLPDSGSVTAQFRGDHFPSIVGAFMIPENDVEKCSETLAKFPGISLNAHKSLVFENLFFISWNGGGVRAVDISNPGTPFEAGFFFNRPVRETQDGVMNPELNIGSSPGLRDGLLYVVDRHSGLYVLKYTGPRKKELPQDGVFVPNAIQVPGRLP